MEQTIPPYIKKTTWLLRGKPSYTSINAAKIKFNVAHNNARVAGNLDRKEALNLFIKNNMKFFLLKKFPSAHFKRAKLDFFLGDRQKKYIGVPRDKEIAEQSVDFLIRNGVIQDEKELKRVLALPFFKRFAKNQDKFKESLILHKNKITAVDVRKLSDSMVIDTIKSQLKEEILEESVSDIQKAIEEKKMEYKLLPSVLDGDDFQEPEIPEPILDAKDLYLPWWQRLGLVSDPFPEQEGLAAIANDMYECVVYKTPIFEKYLFIVRETPEELFKNRVFFGEFGSGKTTLFDYLRKPMNNGLIYNIYIQLYAEQDFQALLGRFRERFFEGLCEIFEIIYQTDPKHWLKSSELQDGISELLKELVSKDDIKGVVVLIDDLHKNRDEIQVALKFINNLQIIRGELIRNNPSLSIAFYIAGSLQWKSVIENDLQYSGSYAKYEMMPPISAEMAYEMLNKRLLAFAGNPDAIREIDLRYVKKIYRGLQNANRPITFRSFIKATLEEFEKYNFTILTADPIAISEERLTKIRDILESDPILKKRIDNLLFGGGIQKNVNRESTLKVLVQTYLYKGILDTSQFLNENKFQFQRLAKSGLIQKVKSAEGLKWVICEELYRQNKLIAEEFNLSLEDYLVKIYLGNLPHKKRKKSRVALKLKPVNDLIKKISKKESKFLLTTSRDGHQKILQQIEKIETKDHPKELLYDCVSSLVLLTKALAKFLEIDFQIDYSEFEFLREFWRDFWYSPGSMAEFLNQAEEDRKQGNKTWYVCALYQETYNEIIKFFKEEVEKSKYFMIDFPYLSNTEIIRFRDIREKWAEGEYFDVAELTTQILEEKFRTFLYNIFALLYGKRENRLIRIDASSRMYIRNNMEKERSRGFKVARNEFEQLNRGNYKNFMVGSFDRNIGKKNWVNIFSNIFSPLTENEVQKFLSAFAEINTVVSHRKNHALSSENQALLLNYVLTSFDLLKKMNKSYNILLDNGFFVEEKDNHVEFRFSFNDLEDKNELEPIIVGRNNAKRVIDALKRQRNKYVIDLEARENLEAYFHIAYREFFAILARLLNQSEQEIKQTGLSVKINRSKGSSVTLSLIKSEGADFEKSEGESIRWK